MEKARQAKLLDGEKDKSDSFGSSTSIIEIIVLQSRSKKMGRPIISYKVVIKQALSLR